MAEVKEKIRSEHRGHRGPDTEGLGSPWEDLVVSSAVCYERVLSQGVAQYDLVF